MLALEKAKRTAEYWYDRAAAATVLAERMATPVTRDMMLGVARDYRKIAEMAERQEKRAAEAELKSFGKDDSAQPAFTAYSKHAQGR